MQSKHTHINNPDSKSVWTHHNLKMVEKSLMGLDADGQRLDYRKMRPTNMRIQDGVFILPLSPKNLNLNDSHQFKVQDIID